jgi:hypothetical protein
VDWQLDALVWQNGWMSAALSSNHACYVYRDQADLVRTAARFIADGIQAGERCWYVAKGDETDALRHTLRDRGVAVAAAERRGALQLYTPTQIYKAVQPFSAERMMEVFSDGISAALTEGYAGFRAAGEMSWADHPAFRGQLLEYEHLITALLVNSRATGLCLFDVRSPHLAAVVAAHPLVARSGGELAPNPRFGSRRTAGHARHGDDQ